MAAQAPATGRWSAAGILCDLDGTLVDSAAAIEQAWVEVADRHGLPRPEVIAALPGRTAHDILTSFLRDSAVIEQEVSWVAGRQLSADGIREIPGARQLLSALPRDRWAVVTAAPEQVAVARITAAGLPLPDVLVGAESVSSGKPSPEGFRRAADLLALDPARCVVLEDSAVGAAAGRSAGARVIGIGTAADVADAVVPDLRWFTDLDTTAAEIRWNLVQPSGEP